MSPTVKLEGHLVTTSGTAAEEVPAASQLILGLSGPGEWTGSDWLTWSVLLSSDPGSS